MKRIVLPVLIIAIIATLFAFLIHSDKEVEVVINDEFVVLVDPVIIEDGKMLFPAQLLFEELGAETTWDSENNIFKAMIGNFAVELTVGSNVVKVDGESQTWESAVKIFDGVVYVPIRASAKTMGAFVEWDDQAGTIYIFTPREFDPELADPAEGPLLNVAYPPQSPFTYYANSLFVFGTTRSYSQVDVKVNGEPVDIIDSRTGNFLTMVEIPRGKEHTIKVEATDASGTTAVERTVLYPERWRPMSGEPLAIHTTNLIPGENQILSPGEKLRIAVQGSPGAEAVFRIGEESNLVTMTELAYPGGPPGEGGIYTAVYTVSRQDVPETGLSGPETITVTLQRNGEQVSRELPGKVTFSSSVPYKVVEIRAQSEIKNRGWLYIIRDNQFQVHSGTLGGTGYSTNVVGYLVEGTRFEATGTSGDYYRVKIGEDDRFLVHKNAVRVLENKSSLDPSLTGIGLYETGEKVYLRLRATERFPFLLEDGTKQLQITLYGVDLDSTVSTPRLTETVEDLKLVTNPVESKSSLILTIELDENMTGFKSHWINSDLLIDIYKAQDIDRNNPLKDKTIIVDPGHGGRDTGAIGPGDVHEKDVVLAMSLHLRDLLVSEGANVIMTRTEDIFVNLYDRPEQIDDFEVDLFISVHANAHAHGAQATEIHGLMILYNYEHNRKLAEIMLDKMEEKTDLPAFRTWRRNIAVLRHPQVPSVLVEAGYLMHPEDNWHILHPRGQKKLALAMREGIIEYFLSLERQPGIN